MRRWRRVSGGFFPTRAANGVEMAYNPLLSLEANRAVEEARQRNLSYSTETPQR